MPAAVALKRCVKREPPGIDANRDRPRDEGRLAPVGRNPARDRRVLRQVQPHLGVSERGQVRDARADRVRELGHRERGGRARVAHGGGGEIDAVREQRVELVAHIAVDPLRVRLPARDRLEPGRALQRDRLRKTTVEHERRLVDLQRDGHPLGGLDQVLLARERCVEHPDEELHEHRRVPRTHHSEGTLYDEHLAPSDDLLEVDAQRVVEEHPLDRRGVEQPRELVHGRVELRGRRAARVSELGGELAREKQSYLLQLGQRPHARANRATVRVALLADGQKPRGVPQARPAVVGEHGDHRVAQVAVGRRADVSVGEQVLERTDDVVRDHVRRCIDRERVEAAGRMREVEECARTFARDEAQRCVGRIALGVEHDYGAALAAKVLGYRRDQVARLSLLDGAGNRRVLTPQRDRDRHRPERVHERPRLGGRPKHPGWRRSDR